MDGTTAYLWHGRLYALEDAPADLLAHLRERGLVPALVETTTDGGRTYSPPSDEPKMAKPTSTAKRRKSSPR